MNTATMTRNSPMRQPDARPRSPRPASTLATNIDPIRVLRRHVLALVASTMFGGVLGVGAYILLDLLFPLYRGEVLFEVQPGVQNASSIGVSEFTNDDLVFRLSKTETFLLTSRSVLEKAMGAQEIKETEWHKQFILEDGTFSIDDAVDELEDTIGTTVVRDSNLFMLSWSTHVPEDVPVILSNIQRTYMNRRTELDTGVYKDNLRLFQDQLAESQRNILQLNLDIEQFITDNGITTLDDPRFSQTALKIEKISGDMSTAANALNIANTNLAQTSAKLEGTLQPTSEDILEADEDPIIKSFAQQEMAIKAELRSAREKYTSPEHVIIHDLVIRLESTETEREAKHQELMNRNLEARLKTHTDEIESYTNILEELEPKLQEETEKLKTLTAKHSEYEEMERRRDHLLLQRDADQQIIKEVQLMQVRVDARRVKVAQPANLPREASFPKPMIVIPLCTLLMLGLTVGIIFLRELTDQRVKSASDLSVIPGANILGVIPEMEEDPTQIDTAELVVRRSPGSILAESYRQTSSSICRAMDRSGHQSLLLIGGLPEAGTTTVVTNVAAVSASTGKKVIVIDANFRRPGLPEAMGLSSGEFGLGDILIGESTLEEAVLKDDSRIDILPAGTVGNRLIERVGGDQFTRLMAELRGEYDLIIFDAPPAVIAGDALTLANLVDASVLVVRANHEQRGLVARLMHQITDARSELLGLLLNRPRETAGGYFKKNYAAMAEYTANSND